MQLGSVVTKGVTIANASRPPTHSQPVSVAPAKQLAPNTCLGTGQDVTKSENIKLKKGKTQMDE